MRAIFTGTAGLLWFGLLGLGAVVRGDVALDPSFGTDGVLRTGFGASHVDTPRDMLILPDGRILAAGLSEATGAVYHVALARYSANGVLDATFGTGGTVLFRDDYRDYANAVALQADGKIVAVGARWHSNFGSDEVPSIYRFEENGSIDLGFGTGGATAVRYDGVSSGEHAGVMVRADGRLVAAGRSSGNASGGANGFGVKRYLDDGTQEASLRLDRNILFNVGSCAFPPDGGVLWVNYEWTGARTEYVLARTDNLGNPDTSFGPSGIRATGIEASQGRRMQLRLLPSGKFLLGGTTPDASFLDRFSVFRFHADGTLDASFGAGGRVDVDVSPGQDHCEDIAVDPDGGIVLAGMGVPGIVQGAIVRLLEDGTPDESFGAGGIFFANLGPNPVRFTRVIPLPAGVILVAGIDYASQGGDFLLARFIPLTTAVGEPAAASLRAGRVFPNPSAAWSRMSLELPAPELVRASIVDVSGRRVRDLFAGALPSGTHVLEWDGRDELGRMVASGVYLVRWETTQGSLVRKVLRVR